MRNRGWESLILSVMLLATTPILPAAGKPDYANEVDRKLGPVYQARAADWRNGAVVYQVIVDRFAPSDNLDAKRALYPAPKRLRNWDETPKAGAYNDEAKVYSHEIDFWGGDLKSLRKKLDYVSRLGVDVLYLSPIHLAYTNHKYDAQDYFEVSPEYGTREDVTRLAKDLHARRMKLVLDGVFNHMGRTSPHFQEALANPKSPWRDWFYIGPEYKHGYRAWYDVANLPEINHESAKVRARLWGDVDSVVQGYLRDGVDGFRLDVAFDIGFVYLGELTRAAHRAKSGSLTVGEIYNYPEEWFPALDGVMDMHECGLIYNFVKGKTNGPLTGRQLERLVADCGLEPLLKSWIVLDNHDRKRLKTEIPDDAKRHMAQVLQFTLPGSPCVYYGVELGMEGGDDPEQRGPMRWDLVNDNNAELSWTLQLMNLRKDCPAVRYGDFKLLDTANALGFVRRTDKVAETAFVVANNTDKELSESIPTRESKIMDGAKLRDAFTGKECSVNLGLINVTIPARTIYVLRPVVPETKDYTHYKRVQ
ncbi:MAG: alpha-glucosidase C-terminal domain-containing protein [Candidatus Sumerlaeaceae bacterium]|nr:alpha-glucosidase C-terminal domain-containing protein [Candidatus Sumerlaeaceae bacterium]